MQLRFSGRLNLTQAICSATVKETVSASARSAAAGAVVAVFMGFP